MNNLSKHRGPDGTFSGITSSAFKYDANVTAQGHVDVPVPLRPGAHVTVFVIEMPQDAFGDLVQVAHSSLDFWDNPFDDEDWNNG